MASITTNNIKPLSALCASCIVTNDLLQEPAQGPEAQVLKAKDLKGRALVVIKDKWSELKRESHPVIQSKMTDIENKLALSCPLDKRDSFLTEKVDELFKALANVFGASQSFGNTIPVDSVSYNQLLQKWEDEALLVLWNKGVVAQLGDQVPAYISAQDIRAYLTEPSNTPLLQQITSLDLSDSGLKVIPLEIQNFPNLTQLYLSNNQILVIPEEIGNLTQLKELDLSKNQILVIPEEIGNLTQLKELDLSKNQILVIPEEIGNLTQLAFLTLSDNLISVIPKEIGECTQLKGLALNKNQILVIPEEIGNLTQLEELHLNFNLISVIPKAIGSLTLLKTLYLNNNRIRVIPEEIGNLTQLEAILLRNNQISTLPGAMGSLTQLKSLSLNGNQISFIPKEFGTLTQLKQLNLNGNQISHIPDAIINWPQHQELSLLLSNNPILFIYNTSSLPESPMVIKPIFDAFKDYDCQSPLSSFFKLVALKPESQEGIKEAFQQLKPKDQNFIFEMVCDEAGVASLQWGKEHVFDSMPIFYRALKKTISTKFDRLFLFPENRNKVYCQIYELGVGPAEWGEQHTSDTLRLLYELGISPVGSPAEWGEQRAFENVLRLIDAMDLANV